MSRWTDPDPPGGVHLCDLGARRCRLTLDICVEVSSKLIELYKYLPVVKMTLICLAHNKLMLLVRGVPDPDPAVNSLSGNIRIWRIFQYLVPHEIYFIYSSLYNFLYSHIVHCYVLLTIHVLVRGDDWPAVLLVVNTHATLVSELGWTRVPTSVSLRTRVLSLTPCTGRRLSVETAVPLCTYISRPSD